MHDLLFRRQHPLEDEDLRGYARELGLERCGLRGLPARRGVWLHLGICLECGHVGCCDDSPNRHATADHHSSGHPLIRSLEPGEELSWCFLDEVAMLIRGLHGHTRIPPSPMLTG